MITDTLKNKIVEAMKAKEVLRVSTLRMLASELHNMEIEKRGKLGEEDEISVVQKEIKKRKDAIEAYEKAGALDKAKQESQELKILKEFLPKQLSDKELVSLVEEAIEETQAKEVKDMGKVIGFVMSKASGKTDGATVAAVVRQKLGKKK